MPMYQTSSLLIRISFSLPASYHSSSFFTAYHTVLVSFGIGTLSGTESSEPDCATDRHSGTNRPNLGHHNSIEQVTQSDASSTTNLDMDSSVETVSRPWRLPIASVPQKDIDLVATDISLLSCNIVCDGENGNSVLDAADFLLKDLPPTGNETLNALLTEPDIEDFFDVYTGRIHKTLFQCDNIKRSYIDNNMTRTAELYGMISDKIEKVHSNKIGQKHTRKIAASPKKTWARSNQEKRSTLQKRCQDTNSGISRGKNQENSMVYIANKEVDNPNQHIHIHHHFHSHPCDKDSECRQMEKSSDTPSLQLNEPLNVNVAVMEVPGLNSPSATVSKDVPRPDANNRQRRYRDTQRPAPYPICGPEPGPGPGPWPGPTLSPPVRRYVKDSLKANINGPGYPPSNGGNPSNHYQHNSLHHGHINGSFYTWREPRLTSPNHHQDMGSGVQQWSHPPLFNQPQHPVDSPSLQPAPQKTPTIIPRRAPPPLIPVTSLRQPPPLIHVDHLRDQTHLALTFQQTNNQPMEPFAQNQLQQEYNPQHQSLNIRYPNYCETNFQGTENISNGNLTLRNSNYGSVY